MKTLEELYAEFPDYKPLQRFKIGDIDPARLKGKSEAEIVEQLNEMADSGDRIELNRLAMERDFLPIKSKRHE